LKHSYSKQFYSSDIPWFPSFFSWRIWIVTSSSILWRLSITFWWA